jgi:thiamine biosynthesis lipoprotein
MISHLSRVTACVLGAWLCGVCYRPVDAAEEFAFHHENVMGTSLGLRVRADSAEAARWAEDRVLREIDRLAEIFSSYDKASELSRWQSTSKGPVKVSVELFEVLRACDDWGTKSGGAFDPRVQALTRLWSSCAEQDRMPTPEELAGAKALMSRPAWRLDPASGTAERRSDCPLSLNAIAKGYIVERACDAAMEKGHGVRGLLLNVGGDMRVCGELSRTIGIADPMAGSEMSEPVAFIEVRDRAVSTSGNAYRGFRIKGRWYSHKLDPQSGAPVERTACATVIAERSADADALATIFNVLPPEESVRLANSLPGVDCLIVTSDGHATRSEGWHRYERPRPAPLALADVQNPPAAGSKGDDGDKADKGEPKAPPGAAWGNEFELLVNFEINRPEGQGGRYRRPYVAIWVEDKDGFPIRNLALWVSLGGSGPSRWLPDLKRWYRSDEARKLVEKSDIVYEIAQPTRPPGKYSVVWDGKDSQGKPLAPGEYTITIDAAREHGTYQCIRKQVTIADKPFAEELKGNVEIKSASIEYRRRTGPDAGARGK